MSTNYPPVAPGPQMGGAPVEHPQGTTILILGIAGLVCCGPLGIAAWIMGNKAIQEIDANPTAYSNRGSVNAGRICGMIATILLILAVILWVVLLAMGAWSVNNTTTTY